MARQFSFTGQWISWAFFVEKCLVHCQCPRMI
jgi:hypothetical protein